MTPSLSPLGRRAALRGALVACPILITIASNAGAGADRSQTWTVPPARATVLASYYEILDSNCKPLRAPPVVLTTRPAQGSISLNTTTMLADNPASCRHVRVPVTQVLFQAGKPASPSNVAWEVHFQSRNLGTLRVQGTVTVSPWAR
jgi:hypothetical protein